MTEQIRIEALSQILQEVGLTATEEQIKQIAEDFGYHIEMEREMESHQFFGKNNSIDVCSKCKDLERQLNEAKHAIRIYHNNVCERRNTTDVWIDKSTEKVMYNPQ